MILCIGGKKYTINVNGAQFFMNIITQNNVVKNIMLKSSDNFILKDINGLYIAAKEG